MLAIIWATGAWAQSPWSAPFVIGVIVNEEVVGPDSCISEQVIFNGDFTMEGTTMVDQDGKTHLRSTVPHLNITATGSAGGQYTAQTVSKLVETISESEVTIEATQIWRLKVSGQGPTNNETFYMTLHFVGPNPNSQSNGVFVLFMGSRCGGR
jgi:hypothetical protein